MSTDVLRKCQYTAPVGHGVMIGGGGLPRSPSLAWLGQAWFPVFVCWSLALFNLCDIANCKEEINLNLPYL